MNDSTIIREKLTLLNASGESIQIDVRYNEGRKNSPVIVICHSFMAFKDWGFFPYIGEQLARAGFVSVAFNFSLNGVVGHSHRITDFEKFERNTFTDELGDLRCVLDMIASGKIAQRFADTERIAVLGHSRGGGIAIVQASKDKRIRALVTWSSISTFDRWTDHQKARWRMLGYLPLAKDSAVSPLALGIRLLDDYEQHKSELDILGAAKKIRAAWFILHGRADVTVHPSEAEKLFQAANHLSTELMIVDAVGHLYNAASRSENNYITLNSILEFTTTFLHRHLLQ